MRQRITLLVAGTTSAIVLAFLIPLALLVQNMAGDRAVAGLTQASQNAAILVASVGDTPSLGQAVQVFNAQSHTGGITVVTPGGSVYGERPSQFTDADLAAARQASAPRLVTRSEQVMSITPVASAGGTTVVVAEMPEAQLRSGVAGAWVTLAVLGLVLILFSVILARQFGARVSKPVTDLADVANRLRAGDFSARAVPAGPPETYQLGTAFNQLADRIGTLIAEEREVVADLGHRLRTPITALRLDTDLVEDPAVADRIRSHVDHLHRSIDAVVREARRHTRESIAPASCDAAAEVTERAQFWRPLAEDQARSLTVYGTSRPALVRIAAEDLREILDTLLDNVFAHTDEGAPVELRVTPSQSVVAVTVADGGQGADPSQMERGASGGGGTGLGLDIVRRLAESSGGSISLRTSNLGGLAVDVILPRAA